MQNHDFRIDDALNHTFHRPGIPFTQFCRPGRYPAGLPILRANSQRPLPEIVIGPGVIRQVPQIITRALGYAPQRVGVIYDRAIQNLVEQNYLNPLRAAGLAVVPIPLGDEHGWLDSTREIGDQAGRSIPPEIDFLIAAGSGVICDLTKWIATYSHKPFILCGSAPSMNGYTSITAVIVEHEIKLTKIVDIPYAVVLDTEIICHAPEPMIQAGVGDLAARAICNADWKLSNFLLGTYFCPLPYEMTAASEQRYLSASEDIARRDLGAITTLTEAIAISGLSMSILNGETSPSSGGEHVISHYWDLMNHLEGAPRNFHGTQVGVGTVIMLAAYEYLRQLDISRLDPEKLVRDRLTLEQIQAMNTARFGAAAAPLNETSQRKYLTGCCFSRIHLQGDAAVGPALADHRTLHGIPRGRSPAPARGRPAPDPDLRPAQPPASGGCAPVRRPLPAPLHLPRPGLGPGIIPRGSR